MPGDALSVTRARGLLRCATLRGGRIGAGTHAGPIVGARYGAVRALDAVVPRLPHIGSLLAVGVRLAGVALARGLRADGIATTGHVAQAAFAARVAEHSAVVRAKVHCDDARALVGSSLTEILAAIAFALAPARAAGGVSRSPATLPLGQALFDGHYIPGQQPREAQGREQAQKRPPRGATAERDGEAIELLGIHWRSSTDTDVCGVRSPRQVSVA